MVVEGILLNGRVYDKKDNSGKGLSINVLINSADLASARIVSLFAGKSYVGRLDLDGYKVLDKINIEYEQDMGSQYPKLINISKAIKK